MPKGDWFLNALTDVAVRDYCIFRLEEISKRGEKESDLPEIVRCLQDLLKIQRRASTKKALAEYKLKLQSYFVKLDRDEQIKIIKYLND